MCTMTEETLMMLVQFGPLVLIFVVLYFVMIRPQRKKDKEAKAMRNAIQVGDEITTMGGIVGIVVSLKEDTIVIETGSDRSKVRIKRWAIQTNDTVHEVSESEVI